MKRKTTISILLITFILMVLSGCQNNDSSHLVSEKDLKNCDVFINNVTCSAVSETRTVNDEAFISELVEICSKVEKFRPVIITDSVTGEPDAYIIFENESVKYMFSFSDTEKQLDIDYIHRDEPLLCVDKYSLDKDKNPSLEWGWYCSLSPTDFATLYDMLYKYTDGEIVK